MKIIVSVVEAPSPALTEDVGTCARKEGRGLFVEFTTGHTRVR